MHSDFGLNYLKLFFILLFLKSVFGSIDHISLSCFLAAVVHKLNWHAKAPSSEHEKDIEVRNQNNLISYRAFFLPILSDCVIEAHITR